MYVSRSWRKLQFRKKKEKNQRAPLIRAETAGMLVFNLIANNHSASADDEKKPTIRTMYACIEVDYPSGVVCNNPFRSATRFVISISSYLGCEKHRGVGFDASIWRGEFGAVLRVPSRVVTSPG